MGKLLATDLDGTLFYPRKIKRCIPLKNILFLRHWIDAGNRLVLITSRSSQFIERLKNEIQRPFDALICSSSEIQANGKVVRSVSIPNATMQEVLNIINKEAKPLGYFMTTDRYPCIIKANRDVGKFFMFFYRLWRFFQFKRCEPFLVSNKKFDEELANANIYKIMVFFGLSYGKKRFTKELNKEFRVKYPRLEFSWSSKVIEITPFGCNKGAGLEYYCDYLHIPKEDVYVVGDSGNDIAMFQKFYEHSYCMSHAYKSVKKYAKNTISRVYKLEGSILKGESHE